MEFTYEILGGCTSEDGLTVTTKVKYSFLEKAIEIAHFMAEDDEAILLGINNRAVSEMRALGLVE